MQSTLIGKHVIVRTYSALAQANIDAYAAGKAYALLTQLHTVAQQIAAAQGATA